MALTNYQKILINRPLPPGTALDKNGNPILVKSDFTSTNWEKVRFTTFSHANAVKNKKECIPLMFEYDSRLNCIWNNPAKYLSKLSTFMAIPTPDFSVYSDMNKKEIEHNVFKSRWLGVWAQYYGCKIIPTITWGDDTTYDLCFSGIEKGSVVAISTIGCQKCKKEFLSGFFEMKKRLCPSLIIVKGKIIEGMSGYLIPISFEETFSIKKSYEQLPLFIQKKVIYIKEEDNNGWQRN